MNKEAQSLPLPHYSMVIEWSDEDASYIVTVPELPGCRTHGATYEEAVRQGEDAIETWIAGALADGEPIPAPRTFAAVASTVRREYAGGIVGAAWRV